MEFKSRRHFDYYYDLMGRIAEYDLTFYGTYNLIGGWIYELSKAIDQEFEVSFTVEMGCNHTKFAFQDEITYNKNIIIDCYLEKEGENVVDSIFIYSEIIDDDVTLKYSQKFEEVLIWLSKDIKKFE